MKKGEATIGGIVISTLIFFGVIIILFNFYGDLRTNYNFEIDGNTSEFYESIEDYADTVYGKTQEIANYTEGGEVETYTQATGLQILTKGIWQGITIIFSFFGIFTALITEISILIGIPPWLMSIILGIISISITFAVIAAVFRRRT